MPAAMLQRLADALAQGADATAALFHPEGYWRDLVAFTWNFHTAQGTDAIARQLAATLPAAAPTAIRPHGEPTTDNGLPAQWFTFETAIGRGRGQLRLKDGRIWTLFTTLRELKGHEEKSRGTREEGVEHTAKKGGRETWQDRRDHITGHLGIDEQPFALIVGGGQGGLGLAARLKRIGVPALVIDAHPRVGDAWRNRYKSLCLHDPVWYDHLPYLPFPDHWPVYTPKDKMGDWLEAYASIMELDIWTSTRCRNAGFDGTTWTVEVDRAGTPHTLRPTHLILATGMSGVPNLPDIPGKTAFQGQQHHSAHHPGGDAWRGKHAIVVGSNNSAHDIAVDLWEHGAASVTMLQRSSTLVGRASTLRRNGDAGLYSQSAVDRGVTVDDADLMVASLPYALWTDAQRQVWNRIRETDADFYARLAKAGFLLDYGEDESGLSLKYQRRGSGYYIDVGGSDLIISGDIRLKSPVQIRELRAHSAVLDNGEELPADLIVYATGYGNMSDWAAQLISPAVAARIGPTWGLGSNTTHDPGPWQGELRNMWKPTAQPNLWFHGGNLAQSRHFSRYLALQLKARLESIPFTVYAPPTPAPAPAG